MYLSPVSLIRAIASHLLVTDLCLQFGRLLLDVRGCYGSTFVCRDRRHPTHSCRWRQEKIVQEQSLGALPPRPLPNIGNAAFWLATAA